MEIKKKERRGIKIEHNKKLFWVIVLLLIALIFLVWFILQNDEIENKECQIDKDCVPSGCCHSESCVPLEEAPNCSGVFCTAVCSGPLDCGEGYCGCVKGKCQVVSNKK